MAFQHKVLADVKIPKSPPAKKKTKKKKVRRHCRVEDERAENGVVEVGYKPPKRSCYRYSSRNCKRRPAGGPLWSHARPRFIAS